MNFLRCIAKWLVVGMGTMGGAEAISAEPALQDRASERALQPAPAQFVTHHRVKVGGANVRFTATAGETYLYNDLGEPIGSIFSYAYIKDEVPANSRPVIFITGGGPGAGSFSLNMAFGPWGLPPDRLALQDGKPPRVTPPFGVVDNPNSLLDVADLVFIDPVGTGYSRILGGGRPEDFWGVDADLESLAQFMQLWLNANERWESPKFFLGESYGGTRAALLPSFLMGGPGYPGYLRAIALNGVVALVNTLGEDLGGSTGLGPIWLAASSLPNQAAASWYHQKIDRRGRSLQNFYQEVTQFALTDYAAALQKEADQTLSSHERTAVVEKLVAFTGLPAAIYQGKLSLSKGEFCQRLLADRAQDIGAYDSRYTTTHGRGAGDPVADDGALSHSLPVLVGAFLAMEHSKLEVRVSRPYAAINWREVSSRWDNQRREDWGRFGTDHTPPPPAHGTNAEELAIAMNRNDRLYAMVATGYFDMGMPPARASLAAQRAGIPSDRLMLERFEAGHEPLVDQAAKGLVEDVRAMIRKASH